ncbi:rhodanese-like domain-containing protein [Glaesserella sp.]|uniref:rhodanese-like domain-containing protein n=1 Tax=Glaesserella sp. TaxID=2094731 RepID=UPI0035A042CA
MNKFSALIIALSGLAAIQPTYATEPVTTQPQNQKAKGIWIDVRSAEEYQTDHIDGALNIPYDALAEQIAKISPNKDEPINLYCRSGRRAEVALTELKKLGYTQVTNHGGYAKLIQKGIK